MRTAKDAFLVKDGWPPMPMRGRPRCLARGGRLLRRGRLRDADGRWRPCRAVAQPEALADDCARAALVVTARQAPALRGTVIDQERCAGRARWRCGGAATALRSMPSGREVSTGLVAGGGRRGRDEATLWRGPRRRELSTRRRRKPICRRRTEICWRGRRSATRTRPGEIPRRRLACGSGRQLDQGEQRVRELLPDREIVRGTVSHPK